MRSETWFNKEGTPSVSYIIKGNKRCVKARSGTWNFPSRICMSNAAFSRTPTECSVFTLLPHQACQSLSLEPRASHAS